MRVLLAAACALPLGLLVIGNTLVRAKAPTDPALAASVWPGHPAALRALAMAQVGEAAASSQPLSAATVERLQRLAARAPLEPEPFLVEAALAARSGQEKRAEQLLLQARQRDPRSPAARFLLADMYMRQGGILEGLREMVVLGRLVSGVGTQLAGTLATYAQSPGALPKLKAALRENPALESQLLELMAADATNADIILTLASDSGPVADEQPAWRGRLLQSLIKAGMYGKAHAIWSRFAGEPPVRSIYRPHFATSSAPPPFNWSFAESGGGVAEPIAGGGLRVLYFGREDVALASQTAVLPSGRYRLSVRVSGQAAGPDQLSWTISCLPGGERVLQLPLGRARQGLATDQFQIPAQGCSAQRIELRGRGAELPKSSDLQMGGLELVRVSG